MTELTAGVKTVCCSEFDKFNTLAITNKYLLEEPPCIFVEDTKNSKEI